MGFGGWRRGRTSGSLPGSAESRLLISCKTKKPSWPPGVTVTVSCQPGRVEEDLAADASLPKEDRRGGRAAVKRKGRCVSKSRMQLDVASGCRRWLLPDLVAQRKSRQYRHVVSLVATWQSGDFQSLAFPHRIVGPALSAAWTLRSESDEVLRLVKDGIFNSGRDALGTGVLRQGKRVWSEGSDRGPQNA